MRYITGIAATIAVLTACSGTASTPPPGAGAAAPQSAGGGDRMQLHPLTHSWMHKAPKGTSGTIWATDLEYAAVDVIAYPSGTLIGQVAGFSYPDGDCSDKAGNVYVADMSNEAGYEIQAGTTKIINSWPTGGETIGCSVSNGGDVAFTNFYPAGVWVFPGGGASGTLYAGPGVTDSIAGYDRRGNLFLVCSNGGLCSASHLAELPAGGSSWILLNFNGTLFGGAVQNMDKYLGIGSSASIELVKVSGSNAYPVKTITLNSTGCSSYMDDASSWGSISKQPNGVVTKKIKGLLAPNLFCFPSPINVYKAKGGDPIGEITAVHYQYDDGVTFTKP